MQKGTLRCSVSKWNSLLRRLHSQLQSLHQWNSIQPQNIKLRSQLNTNTKSMNRCLYNILNALMKQYHHSSFSIWRCTRSSSLKNGLTMSTLNHQAFTRIQGCRWFFSCVRSEDWGRQRWGRKGCGLMRFQLSNFWVQESRWSSPTKRGA